ncbi:C1 family peptidase [uncultured Sphaerochaeta sp.]|uniref:aminopeptidase C n=1 Tax=uncultured Sphaerochaeta sp. TaxID=886478 RepID=UPI002A0A181B|nr:C1 family peptidase [uncultured Sphaerochaeta sp.]
MKENIEFSNLKDYESTFEADRKNEVAMHATVANGILESCKAVEAVVANSHNFSISIEAGEMTNQKKSGRCWMFAALNVMRLEIMEKLNLKNMELSQAYPLFWDKLEKANYFLENIIETLEEPLEGRVINYLLKDPLGDGGQWDMFADLVAKYGVVPKEMMPESKVSSETNRMNRLLTVKLREFAYALRTANSQGKSLEELRKLKESQLSTIYTMLCISLGKPPKEFTYETRDKDDKFIRISKITPQEFYKKYVSLNLEDYVSLINAPTSDKPFGKTYTVQYLGNVRGGKPVRYLNLPIEELKKAAIKQMQDGKAVWFGSDVGQNSDKDSGLMALDTYDLEGLFSTTFPLDKAQRLDYGESLMTHAMVLTGVNLDENGTPNRWRVENSWGEEPGVKGYFVMSDDWFNEYTYQVVVNKKYLSKEQREAINQEPIVLKPWDPMGSLAK